LRDPRNRPVNNGIYTGYSGMRAQADALDLLSNNLANANTSGFKEEMANFSLINQPADGGLNSTINRTVMTQGSINSLEGSMSQTNRDLDIAIEGNGFLAVQTPRGIRYTRNGSLKMNAQGVLCCSEGSPVLGINGRPIALGPGKVQISENGTVSLENQPVDQLKVVTFDKGANFTREGNSLFALTDGKVQEKIADAKIKSGYLEQSNVNPVTSIVRMVEIMRHFEAMKKCVDLIINDINSKSIDKLGR
jgi:flagellar basal-body rod protein FlgF